MEVVHNKVNYMVNILANMDSMAIKASSCGVAELFEPTKRVDT